MWVTPSGKKGNCIWGMTSHHFGTGRLNGRARQKAVSFQNPTTKESIRGSRRPKDALVFDSQKVSSIT
jgi:hypothetical protein